MPLDPTEDSDVLMRAYIVTVKTSGDVFQLLSDDEESSPSVKREWVLEDLPDPEIMSVAADAWVRVGALLQALRGRIGLPPIDIALNCRHSEQRVQFRTYNRNTLREWLDQLRWSYFPRRSSPAPTVSSPFTIVPTASAKNVIERRHVVHFRDWRETERAGHVPCSMCRPPRPDPAPGG